MSKQILILNGSPRIHGNTAALIDAFTAGAEAGGPTPSPGSIWPLWTSTAAGAA